MATKLEIRQRTDDIIEMVKSGVHLKEVALTFSIKVCSVRSLLRKNNIFVRKGKLSENDIKEILSLYHNGLPTTEISKIFNVKPPTIRHVLLQNGVILRTSADSLRLNKSPINKEAFKDDAEVCAYLYGWLLTDGNLNEKGRVSLEINRKDEKILEFLKLYLKSTNKIYRRDRFDSRTQNTYYMSSFSFQDPEILKTLKNLGLKQRKSLAEVCPDKFLGNRHFWRGTFEGDGHISKSNNMISLVGSETLINQFYDYCRSVCGDLKGTISRSGKMYVAQVCNRVHITQILDSFYKDAEYVLTRKYNIYLERYANR